MVHAINPSSWEAKGGRSFEFKANLIYRMSSRTARTTQRNPVSNKTKQKIQKIKYHPIEPNLAGLAIVVCRVFNCFSLDSFHRQHFHIF